MSLTVEQLSCSKSFGCAILRYRHNSSTLGGLSAIFSVILPPNAKGASVLYYLSGLTCTDQNFITKAGAARAAAKFGVAIVAPDTSPRGAGTSGEDNGWDIGTGAGFYLDAVTPGWKKHYRMESYIMKELGKAVKEALGDKVRLKAGSIGICGHSMGGQCLALALRHPGFFSSVSAFSPIANPSECPWGVKAFSLYLGDDKTLWEEHDPTCLVTKRGKGGLCGDTRILIDQGRNDEFLESGQLRPESFQHACEKVGQAVDLRMRDGYDHSYHFISTFIDEHIEYHSEAFTSVRSDMKNNKELPVKVNHG